MLKTYFFLITKHAGKEGKYEEAMSRQLLHFINLLDSSNPCYVRMEAKVCNPEEDITLRLPMLKIHITEACIIYVQLHSYI